MVNILTRDEFKQLLNDNPTKRFLFLEWEPNVWISDFHISSGDPKFPGFGASVMGADPNEDLIFDYDWNIDEYLSDDKFAVLSENEISQLIDIFRLCVTKGEANEKQNIVYTQENTLSLRNRFVDDVIAVFSSAEAFLDFVEDGEHSSKYDVFFDCNSETYIINRETGKYINWYKACHIGRDIHTNVEPDKIKEFLKEFKEDSDEVNEELLKAIGCPNPGYMLSSEEIHKALENMEDSDNE